MARGAESILDLERITGSRPARGLVNLGFHLAARLRCEGTSHARPDPDSGASATADS